MDSFTLSLIVFACVLLGSLVGLFLRNRLPGHHLSDDAKDVVRLGTGLIGTIAALVLGLLIASAKNSYDAQNAQTKQLIANFILLDGILAQYGTDTLAVRALMRNEIVNLTERIWRQDESDRLKTKPFEAGQNAEAFFYALQELSPKNDSERSLKERAIQTSTDIARARLLLFAQADNSMPMPFLVVLIFWLTIIFASFSLFAQPNVIIFGALCIFSLSTAGAIFLILELNQPFAGLMQISNEPMRNALAPLKI